MTAVKLGVLTRTVEAVAVAGRTSVVHQAAPAHSGEAQVPEPRHEDDGRVIVDGALRPVVVFEGGSEDEELDRARRLTSTSG